MLWARLRRRRSSLRLYPVGVIAFCARLLLRTDTPAHLDGVSGAGDGPSFCLLSFFDHGRFAGDRNLCGPEVVARSFGVQA